MIELCSRVALALREAISGIDFAAAGKAFLLTAVVALVVLWAMMMDGRGRR